MFSTKIRTTVATLAAAFTVLVAIGPLAPATQAQIFRPEQIKKARICQLYKDAYEGAVAGAVQIDGNPDGANNNDAGAEKSDQEANQTRDAAKKAGCGWAA